MSELRKYYSDQLEGSGLDIGALHRPMLKHDKMKVTYVDRLTVEQMLEHYPELKEHNLQAPDIIDDAQYLKKIPDNSQDFVIAAHVIEHMANPFLALENWHRVCKPGGKIYLVVPHYQMIFDKYREETTMKHMLGDYFIRKHYGATEISENWNHYLEYSEKVDKKIGEEIEIHAQKLWETGYSIHHHCFTPESFRTFIGIAHNVFCSFEQELNSWIGEWDYEEGDTEFHYMVEVVK